MRKSIKTISYILIVGLTTWALAFIVDILIMVSRIDASSYEPGDLTDEQEWSSFYFNSYSITVVNIFIFLLFRFVGKTRIHPIVQYGAPIIAIIIFVIFIYDITVGYSIWEDVSPQ